MGALPGDLTALWGRLPRGQQILLAGLAGGGIALFVLMLSWSRSPDFVPLYTGLDPADASAIVDQLQTRGIPHEVAAGGTTVRVPSAQVAEARIDLAAEGLPAGGGVGFEVFDGQSFGVTDFVQQINLRRSLEGELTRTINQIDGVHGSRVHIAIPQDQLFSDLQEATTASIVLDIRAGRSLSQARVRGVAHLVAQSVEGLEPEGVTILNTKGDILFDGGDDATVGGSTQIEATQAYEQRLERDLGLFLRSALGPNKSAVAVTAVLDFTATETTSETYVPVAGGERSSQNASETFREDGAESQLNVPGAAANLPGADQAETEATGASTTSEYTRTEATVNNELNRILQVTRDAPGQVKTLSVSVILDTAITEEQATELQAAIAAAAGLLPDRGDVLSVTRVPFDTTEIDEAQAAIAAEAASTKTTNMIRMAIPVLAVLIAGGLFFFLLRKLSQARAVGGRPYGVTVDANGLPMLPSGERVADAQKRLMEEQRRQHRELVGQEVAQLVRTQPKAVAEVVQTWVREEP